MLDGRCRPCQFIAAFMLALDVYKGDTGWYPSEVLPIIRRGQKVGLGGKVAVRQA